MSEKINKILLVDGNSLFFKSFYGSKIRLDNGEERNDEGVAINALRIFSLLMINLRKKFENQKIFVAFDERGANTFRHQFDFYKANRSKQPQDLYDQIPLVREFLDLYGIKWNAMQELEADDLIGIFSEIYKNNNYDVHVVSGDKDLLQLVDKNVTVHLSKRGISDLDTYNNDNFGEKFYGLSPLQIPDFKGISGDSSDNIVGIPGIGEKGAINLLRKYVSLELIYDNLDGLTPATKNKLLEGKEKGIESKKIATIIRKSNLVDKNEDLSIKEINKELNDFLVRHKLFNVIKKINDN